jgi:hypothetical protein
MNYDIGLYRAFNHNPCPESFEDDMWLNMKERFDKWLTMRMGMERLAHVILFRCCRLQNDKGCTLYGSWHPRAHEDSFLREVALGVQGDPFEEMWWGDSAVGCFKHISVGIQAKRSQYKDRMFQHKTGPFSPGMAAIIHNDIVAFEVCLQRHVQLRSRGWKAMIIDELFSTPRSEMLSIVFTLYKEQFLPALVESRWWKYLKPGEPMRTSMALVTKLLLVDDKKEELAD